MTVSLKDIQNRFSSGRTYALDDLCLQITYLHDLHDDCMMRGNSHFVIYKSHEVHLILSVLKEMQQASLL